MTFSGSGMEDLQQVLREFPRTFTLPDLITHFDWPLPRARQAIVNGQQQDIVRILIDHKNQDNRYAIYENARWRREWISKPWRNEVEL